MKTETKKVYEQNTQKRKIAVITIKLNPQCREGVEKMKEPYPKVIIEADAKNTEEAKDIIKQLVNVDNARVMLYHKSWHGTLI